MAHHEFPLTDVHSTGTGHHGEHAGGCGCGDGASSGGCGCGGHHEHHHEHATEQAPEARTDTTPSTTVTEFGVSGMTCGHCVTAVEQEVGAIAGVTTVDVDLHPGETSHVTVHSTTPLTDEALSAAVDEAGYSIVH